MVRRCPLTPCESLRPTNGKSFVNLTRHSSKSVRLGQAGKRWELVW